MLIFAQEIINLYARQTLYRTEALQYVADSWERYEAGDDCA